MLKFIKLTKLINIILALSFCGIAYAGTSCTENGRVNPCGANTKCYWPANAKDASQAICECVKGASKTGKNANSCTFDTPCTPNNGAGPCDVESTTCTYGGNPPVANCICKNNFVAIHGNKYKCKGVNLPATAPAPSNQPATGPFNLTAAAPALSGTNSTCNGKNIGDKITVDGKEAFIYQITPTCNVALYVEPYRNAAGIEIAQNWGGTRNSQASENPTPCDSEYFFNATDVDNGQANTAKIMDQLKDKQCDYEYSARLCNALTPDGSWYMPALNESMQIAKTGVKMPKDNTAIMSSTEKAKDSYAAVTGENSTSTYVKTETRFALYCSKKLK